MNRWLAPPKRASSRTGSETSNGSLAGRRWRSRSRRRPSRRRGQKTDLAADVAAQGRFPVSIVAETIGVSRSRLHARVTGASKRRGRYHKPEDDALLPAIRRLVDARPTYGYRRIAALLNRERRTAGLGPVNHKRVLRILGLHGPTLERSTGRREGRVHDRKVAVMSSDGAGAPPLGTSLRNALSGNGCARDRLLERREGQVRGSLEPMAFAPHPSSSMPSTARSSRTRPWRTPASAAPTSET